MPSIEDYIRQYDDGSVSSQRDDRHSTFGNTLRQIPSSMADLALQVPQGAANIAASVQNADFSGEEDKRKSKVEELDAASRSIEDLIAGKPIASWLGESERTPSARGGISIASDAFDSSLGDKDELRKRQTEIQDQLKAAKIELKQYDVSRRIAFEQSTTGKIVRGLEVADKNVQEFYDVDPDFAKSTYGQIVSGLSQLPLYAAASFGGWASFVPIVGSTSVQQAMDDYDQTVESRGETPNPTERLKYGLVVGIPVALSERLGFEAIIGKLFKGTKEVTRKELMDRLKSLDFDGIKKELGPRVAEGFAGEGGTEVLQNIWQNAIAQATIDPERTNFTKDGLKQNVQAFFVAGTVGALGAGAHTSQEIYTAKHGPLPAASLQTATEPPPVERAATPLVGAENPAAALIAPPTRTDQEAAEQRARESRMRELPPAESVAATTEAQRAAAEAEAFLAETPATAIPATPAAPAPETPEAPAAQVELQAAPAEEAASPKPTVILPFRKADKAWVRIESSDPLDEAINTVLRSRFNSKNEDDAAALATAQDGLKQATNRDWTRDDIKAAFYPAMRDAAIQAAEGKTGPVAVDSLWRMAYVEPQAATPEQPDEAAQPVVEAPVAAEVPAGQVAPSAPEAPVVAEVSVAPTIQGEVPAQVQQAQPPIGDDEKAVVVKALRDAKIDQSDPAAIERAALGMMTGMDTNWNPAVEPALRSALPEFSSRIEEIQNGFDQRAAIRAAVRSVVDSYKAAPMSSLEQTVSETVPTVQEQAQAQVAASEVPEQYSERLSKMGRPELIAEAERNGIKVSQRNGTEWIRGALAFRRANPEGQYATTLNDLGSALGVSARTIQRLPPERRAKPTPLGYSIEEQRSLFVTPDAIDAQLSESGFTPQKGLSKHIVDHDGNPPSGQVAEKNGWSQDTIKAAAAFYQQLSGKIGLAPEAEAKTTADSRRSGQVSLEASPEAVQNDLSAGADEIIDAVDSAEISPGAEDAEIGAILDAIGDIGSDAVSQSLVKARAIGALYGVDIKGRKLKGASPLLYSLPGLAAKIETAKQIGKHRELFDSVLDQVLSGYKARMGITDDTAKSPLSPHHINRVGDNPSLPDATDPKTGLPREQRGAIIPNTPGGISATMAEAAHPRNTFAMNFCRTFGERWSDITVGHASILYDVMHRIEGAAIDSDTVESLYAMKIEIVEEAPSDDGSLASYDFGTNTLRISQNVPSKDLPLHIIHEMGHFFSHFVVGPETLMAEWGQLSPEARMSAVQAYLSSGGTIRIDGTDYNSRTIKSINPITLQQGYLAAQEWAAMQWTRIVRDGEESAIGKMRGESISESFISAARDWWNALREIVQAWIGDVRISSAMLDDIARGLMGFSKATVERGPVKRDTRYGGLAKAPTVGAVQLSTREKIQNLTADNTTSQRRLMDNFGNYVVRDANGRTISAKPAEMRAMETDAFYSYLRDSTETVVRQLRKEFPDLMSSYRDQEAFEREFVYGKTNPHPTTNEGFNHVLKECAKNGINPRPIGGENPTTMADLPPDRRKDVSREVSIDLQETIAGMSERLSDESKNLRELTKSVDDRIKAFKRAKDADPANARNIDAAQRDTLAKDVATLKGMAKMVDMKKRAIAIFKRAKEVTDVDAGAVGAEGNFLPLCLGNPELVIDPPSLTASLDETFASRKMVDEISQPDLVRACRKLHDWLERPENKVAYGETQQYKFMLGHLETQKNAIAYNGKQDAARIRSDRSSIAASTAQRARELGVRAGELIMRQCYKFETLRSVHRNDGERSGNIVQDLRHRAMKAMGFFDGSHGKTPVDHFKEMCANPCFAMMKNGGATIEETMAWARIQFPDMLGTGKASSLFQGYLEAATKNGELLGNVADQMGGGALVVDTRLKVEDSGRPLSAARTRIKKGTSTLPTEIRQDRVRAALDLLKSRGWLRNAIKGMNGKVDEYRASKVYNDAESMLTSKALEAKAAESGLPVDQIIDDFVDQHMDSDAFELFFVDWIQNPYSRVFSPATGKGFADNVDIIGALVEARMKAGVNESGAKNPTKASTFFRELWARTVPTAPDGSKVPVPEYSKWIKAQIISLDSRVANMQSVMDTWGGVSKFGESNTAHAIMDEIDMMDWPSKYVDYYDGSGARNQMMINNLAFHAAFGRDGATLEGYFAEIEDDLRGLEAKRTSLVNAARLAGAKTQEDEDRYIKSRVSNDDFVRMSPDRIARQRTLAAKLHNGLRERFLPALHATENLTAVEELAALAVQSALVGPKSAIANLAQVVIAPFIQTGISPTTAKQIGRQVRDNFAAATNSILQLFGRTVSCGATATRMANLYTNLYGLDPEIGGPSSVAISRAEGRDLQQFSRWRRILRGTRRVVFESALGRSRPGQKYGAVNLNPFAFANNVTRRSAFNSGVLPAEEMMSKAMDFLSRNSDAAKKLVDDPEWRFTAEMLGYGQGLMIGDKAAFDALRSDMAERAGISLEERAREVWMARQSGKIIPAFTDQQYALLGQGGIDMYTNASNMLTTRNATLVNSRWGRMLGLLLGWSINQWNVVIPRVVAGPSGNITARSAARGAATVLLGIIPMTVLWSFWRDLWDEEVTGKKNAIRPLFGYGADNMMISATERLVREGTLGMPAELVLSTLFATTGQVSGDLRGGSIDQRVFITNMFTQVKNAAANIWSTEGTMTYASVYKPLMMAFGGSGPIGYWDMVNGVFGLDNAESRVLARTNIGNILRTAGQAEGMELSPTGAGSVTRSNPVTPWVTEMILAAYANDRQAFMEARRNAVAASRKRGDANPYGFVDESFADRHPLKTTFRTRPSVTDVQKMLRDLPDRQREDLRSGLALYNRYLITVGKEPYYGKTY